MIQEHNKLGFQGSELISFQFLFLVTFDIEKKKWEKQFLRAKKEDNNPDLG